MRNVGPQRLIGTGTLLTRRCSGRKERGHCMAISAVTVFRVGELYTNDQIRFTLEVENLGGIRPSVDARRNLRHIALMTTAEESGRVMAENPYHDRIEGDILLYTAKGPRR